MGLDFKIPISWNYSDHDKTGVLISLIGPRADCFPIRMWMWAGKYAKDGKFKNAGLVEIACRWDGAPGECVKAMIEAEFLKPDGTTIINWFGEGRIGTAIAAYEKKKIKNVERRKGSAQVSTPSAGDSSGVKLLLDRMKENHVTGTPQQKREHAEAWYSTGRAQKAEALIMGEGKGKGIFWLEKALDGNGRPQKGGEAPGPLVDVVKFFKEGKK